MTIQSRQDLVEYIYRKLGAPVIEINLDDTQVEDSITDALQFFQEYHFDGSERRYISQQVTQADIDNKYIQTPPNVSSVSRVFRKQAATIGSGNTSPGNLFDLQHQFTKNEIYEIARNNTGGLLGYYVTFQYISNLDDIINFHLYHRFRKPTRKLHIDTDWQENFPVGSFIVYECFEEINPETFSQIYDNWYLKRLCVAHAKKQWATNIKKFAGIQLPGGVTLDGQTMYSEAIEEITMLEQDVIQKFSEPDGFLIG